jgi:hypothetical protein
MKRGLKVETEVLSAAGIVLVEEHSPMKRGLKVPPSTFGQGYLLSDLTRPDPGICVLNCAWLEEVVARPGSGMGLKVRLRPKEIRSF